MRFQSGITDQYIYFVAVDSTDLKTRETGLSSFTVYRARNGGAATAYTTPTVAEVSSANMPGVYSLLLDEDMTIDSGDDSQAVVLHITQASMAPVTLTYELYRPIVTAGQTIDVATGGVEVATFQTGAITAAAIAADAITDAKVASDVTIASVTGAVGSVTGNVGGNVTGSVGSVATGGITATSIAADAIGASELAADAVTEIAAGVWDRLTSALTTVGSAGKLLVDNLNATISSRASQTSLDTVDDFLDTEIAAIKTKTDFLPSATAGAAGGLFIAGTNAATTITTALTTTFTGNLTGSVASVTGAVGSVTGNVGGNVTGSVGSIATGGIAAASFAAGAIDSAAIATDAIGSNELAASAIAEIQSGLSNLSQADIRTAVGLASANLDTQLAALPTAAENADAVWEEAIADHSGTVGSTAEALGAASSAGDPWSTALPGAYGVGTAGKIIGDNINATISSRASQTSVDDLPTNAELATALAGADDAVLAALATTDGKVDAIKAKTDNLTFTVAGQVDSNIQYVNDVEVTGNGQTGTEWGP